MIKTRMDYRIVFELRELCETNKRMNKYFSQLFEKELKMVDNL